MKIAIIGANGQLGSDVLQAFARDGAQVVTLTHADIEISSLDSVSSVMGSVRPHLIVNTAAMHHVELCEQKPDAAFATNALGARNLALSAQQIQATLMHVSTDYVFDGNKRVPYTEQDAPAPLNVYGKTKLAGEDFVRRGCEKYFVLRTSALYGTSPCRAKGGLNFVELMLKLARERGQVKVVDSEFISPTSTAELAKQMVALSHSRAYGLYHATAEESCSWHEFAREIFALTGTTVSLRVAGANEFPAKVPRPHYSVLENAGLKALGLNVFEPWQAGLQQYLKQTHPLPEAVLA